MCLIVYTKINGKKFLIKNRDRGYDPKIEIIHEIIKGIEVVYYKDLITGWNEGMNELGIGLINSTLNNKLFISKNKNKDIYDALIDRNFENKISTCFQNKKCEKIIEGHNLIVTDLGVFHVEQFTDNDTEDFFFYKLNENEPVVFSNHSIHGNNKIKGFKKKSSFLRKKIAEDEISQKKIQNIEQVLQILNTNYTNIDPRFHPYRDSYYSLQKNKKLKKTKKTLISTSAQIVMNMTDKTFNYYSDMHHNKVVNYINKLPNNYVPKIKIFIHPIQKNLTFKKQLSKKKIQTAYKKFQRKSRKLRKSRKQSSNVVIKKE